ncbi:hypothetical protein PIB30_006841 [Stylosanthes scabra]|uniref:Uncharacterized protein n=1 Tax=Stylosanthes scabra TaxID=79078 RepID=A0ABU6V5U4_9FABA|nr:hypothetical protein [Stylosanthes scabra]
MAVPSSSVRVLRRGWLHRASPIAAKPPPLLATVLPWDRDGDDLAMVQVAQERGPEEKGRRAEIVVCGESEIHVKIPLVAESIAVEALRRGSIMYGSSKSAVSLAIVPILSSTQVMLSGTKGGPPFAELRFRIESPSMNLIEACVAAEAIEVCVVDELASSLPTARNNDLLRGKEVGIDRNSGSNKPHTHTKRTHHANETIIAVEALPQGIKFQFYIIHVKVEELNRDLIGKCKEIIHKCINDAKMDKREVQDVVNFDKTVAYGAAIQATTLSESYSIVPNMVLVDVIPLFLGVAFHGDLRSVVIMQNTAIHGNNLLGLVLLEKLSAVPQNHPINVTFEFDFDGILIGIEEAAKCHVHVILIGTTKHSNSINLTLKGFDRIAREINIVVTAEVGQPVARNMNSIGSIVVLHSKKWDPGGMLYLLYNMGSS